jgi:hypothetical protein
MYHKITIFKVAILIERQPRLFEIYYRVKTLLSINQNNSEFLDDFNENPSDFNGD